MNKILHTKFGTGKINDNGYYQITSSKEGNGGKYLHRLVFEDYHNCKLDENDVIHHIDSDKTNNHPSNLICMSKKAHDLLHNKYKTIEHKQKISKSLTGRTYSDERRINQSKSKNTTGYFRVSKVKDKRLTQGFRWVYRYYKNNKTTYISSVSLEKLEEKVKQKGLLWKKIREVLND